MATEENPHAGQGAVVLDIGGDIGALIVEMPADMEDLEVEIIPTGTDSRPHQVRHGHDGNDHDGHGHGHGHDHGSPGDLSHSPADGHSHEPGAPPHVAVVARTAPDGSTIHSLVYGEVQQGTYDLYVRPDGPIRLTATVVGGEVTHMRWPD